MRVLLIALVLALALVGAGCGGDDDEASDETDTTITDTVTDETTTDDETTEEDEDETTDGDETIGDSLASEECQELIAASAALSAAFSAAGSGEDLEESRDAFNRFADDAPDEIREDLQTLAEGYSTYIDAIQELDLDAGETPSAEQAAELQTALAPLNEAEFTEASQRFSTWAAANC